MIDYEDFKRGLYEYFVGTYKNKLSEDMFAKLLDVSIKYSKPAKNWKKLKLS